jgi:hypothetical protein
MPRFHGREVAVSVRSIKEFLRSKSVREIERVDSISFAIKEEELVDFLGVLEDGEAAHLVYHSRVKKLHGPGYIVRLYDVSVLELVDDYWTRALLASRVIE